MRTASGVWDGVQTEITETKLAQFALARNKARLNTVLDCAQDAIISIDGDGVIQSVNAAGVTMFGYARDEIIGRDIGFLMPNAYRKRTRRRRETRRPTPGSSSTAATGAWKACARTARLFRSRSRSPERVSTISSSSSASCATFRNGA